jgi:branched-chain amino acid aminotransferase
MIHLPLHSWYVHNDGLRPNIEFKPPRKTGGVYEVIRVAEGVPLFLEEHLERFFNSARLAGTVIRFSVDEISGQLTQLIRRNEVAEGNILLLCKRNLKAFFIQHKYPESRWYISGVPCGLLKAERNNPNAKVFQTNVRQMADDLMQSEGWYEVLLVDHSENITEGSRSNVFFVSGDKLLTPPGFEVLIGITRQRTIQLAKDAGIPVAEEDIALKDIPAMQAAFITGTSPKILPVSQVGTCSFDPMNPVVQALRIAYDQLIDNYIASHRQL